MVVQDKYKMVYKIINHDHPKTFGKFQNFMCVVYSKLALLLQKLFIKETQDDIDHPDQTEIQR